MTTFVITMFIFSENISTLKAIKSHFEGHMIKKLHALVLSVTSRESNDKLKFTQFTENLQAFQSGLRALFDKLVILTLSPHCYFKFSRAFCIRDMLSAHLTCHV